MCFSMKNDKYIKLYQISNVVNKLRDKFLRFNSILSKWYESLDDKSVCSVSSLRVKFNVDVSFSEMGRLYLIKYKQV